MADATLLDASAVLALLQAEAGADVVADTIETALITAVTRTEILGRLARFGGDGTPALDRLSLPVLPYTAAEADAAARLLAAHRGVLSLGDCACLATAARQALPVLGDRLRTPAGRSRGAFSAPASRLGALFARRRTCRCNQHRPHPAPGRDEKSPAGPQPPAFPNGL